MSSERVRQYADDVLAGRIVAGPHVRNACRRHLDDLEKGHERGLWFDDEAAARIIDFFEEVLHLSEGQFEGEPFKVEPSQAFILGSLFGWKRADGTRRFRRAYIEQGKGNGKSPLAGGIGLYGLCADQEAGAQVYAAAAKKEQANILFQDACKMVRAAPELSGRLNFSGSVGREFNIAHIPSGSYFRPVSRDTGKTGSGPRPYFVLADEIHELPDRKILEVLERGFKWRRSPLIVMITNSGSDRNSVAWEEHEHAIKVAAGSIEAVNDAAYVGEPLDDSTFSYVCALDKDDNPLEDSSCWIKANPLLGITITKEYLAEAVGQAKAMPGKLNGILRLHFCQWTDAETAWMTRASLEPCLADFDPLQEHAGKPVYIGADLSQVRDLTALAYCVQAGNVESGEHAGKPVYDAWVQCWTPGDTLEARELSDKAPYSVWVRDGFLEAPKGKTIAYRHVAQALAEAQHSYDIQCLAYDRYAFARMLEPELNELGLSFEAVEHPQGGTKKGKPTETMKIAAAMAEREPEGLWMPRSVRQVEELLLQGRIRLQRNPVLISAMMSAVTDEDRWGNYWLAKERAVQKIDAAVALCMAVGAAISYEGASTQSFWEVI